MNILRTFCHNGKAYNVVIDNNDDADVIIYATNEDGSRANGYSHHISFMTLFDMSQKYGRDFVINDMVETVEEEIKKNMWGKYIDSLNKQNNDPRT